MCRGVDLKAVCVDMERHDIGSDYFIIEDRVYDASQFRWKHPGGPLFVSMFGGRDATLAFQSYHMREFPHEMMKKYLVGFLKGRTVSPDKEHAELSKLIKSVVGKGSAPNSQLVKAACLFVAALVMEVMCFYDRTWARSIILGILFALIGLNVQHDANHGATRALFGLSQNWIGGSRVMWLQEHVVLHHLHTGDYEMDPDAQMAPVMRGHEKSVWYPWMAFQHFYLFLLELCYGVVPVLGILEIVAWKHKFEEKYKLSELAKPWRLESIFFHCLFYVRFGVIPYLQNELPKVAATIIAGGAYLAFFFFLSHNFEGTQFFGNSHHSGQFTGSFLRQQAATSSDVGGPLLCFVNGGLNYQIEHHLFPRVAHSHYPKIAPVVKKFFAMKGIQYTHFESILANATSVFKHVKKMSVKPLNGDLKKRK